MPLPSKRRRTSDESKQGSDIIPPDVVDSNPESIVADENTGGNNVEFVQPVLEEIPQLVLVDMQKDDAEEVAEAMERLATAMDDEKDDEWEKNIEDAIGLGAIAVVIGGMQKWQRHKQVQTNGSLCLCNLTYRTYRNDQSKAWVSQAGGIEAAINAMKLFPNDEGVNEHAVCIMRNLMWEERVRKSICNRFVHNLHGPELLVKTMVQFSDMVEIQESCCIIFDYLAQENNLRDLIEKSSAISAVATAMDCHNENGVLKACAKSFMKNMFSET